VKRFSLAVVLAAAAGWAAAGEVVVFPEGRALYVKRAEDLPAGMLLLVLPGGNTLALPRERVVERIPGAPPDDPGPAEDIPFADIIREACKEYEVDWKLVVSLIRVESAFRPRAVSPKGAQGLMQLMPSVQEDYGVDDPFDPGQNIRAGVHFLKDLLVRFQGNLELTLAAYNAGARRVERSGGIPAIPETRAYVAKVLAGMRE